MMALANARTMIQSLIQKIDLARMALLLARQMAVCLKSEIKIPIQTEIQVRMVHPIPIAILKRTRKTILMMGTRKTRETARS
jgi:hypothetical protein